MKPIDQAYADHGLCRLGAAMKLLQVDRRAITHLVNQRQLTLVEFDWKNGKQHGIPLSQLKDAFVMYKAVIAALFCRIRSRKARRQIRWSLRYMRERYGDSHAAAREQALAAWEKHRP